MDRPYNPAGIDWYLQNVRHVGGTVPTREEAERVTREWYELLVRLEKAAKEEGLTFP